MNVKIRLALIPVVLCGLVFAQPGAAEEGQEEAAPRTLDSTVEEFFAKVAIGEYKESIEFLYADNPWAAKIADQIDALKDKFVALPDVVGTYIAHDKVIEQKVSGRFVYLWYMVSFDRQPLSFHFTFYRPAEEWLVYSFEYRDDVKNLAEELAKRQLSSPRYGDGGTGVEEALTAPGTGRPD